MDEKVVKVIKWLFPTLSPVIILLLVLLFAPEKIEKWSSILWRAIDSLGSVFRSAHKRYVKHDLQGRVNEFVKKLRRDVPTISTEKLRIEFVDPNTPRKVFLDQGQVVLRLRRDDPRDENFVHGAYLFVSGTVLQKAKRYLSPSQRQAIDLFVCTKLLEAEKPSIGIFLDEYLHPKTEDRKSKVALYVDDFSIIHRGQLFFSVFLQELEYLGDKVFGRRRDDLVHSEVNRLVEFLKPIATRRIGDEGDLNFYGEYCRFGLVIIGKPSKLFVSIEPYVTYISRQLVSKDAETIYLIARQENHRRVDEIYVPFSEAYECVRRARFTAVLDYGDRKERARQCLAVLRRRGQEIIKSSVR